MIALSIVLHWRGRLACTDPKFRSSSFYICMYWKYSLSLGLFPLPIFIVFSCREGKHRDSTLLRNILYYTHFYTRLSIYIYINTYLNFGEFR